MKDCKCKGRGFYLVLDRDGKTRCFELCGHKPEPKHKRKYETLLRIIERNK